MGLISNDYMAEIGCRILGEVKGRSKDIIKVADKNQNILIEQAVMNHQNLLKAQADNHKEVLQAMKVMGDTLSHRVSRLESQLWETKNPEHKTNNDHHNDYFVESMETGYSWDNAKPTPAYVDQDQETK